MPSRCPPPRRRSNSSSNYECGDGSNHSQIGVRPSLRHYGTDISQHKAGVIFDQYSLSPTERRASVATFASTTPSEAEAEAETDDDFQGYEVYDEPQEYDQVHTEPVAVASTPSEFAEYFPSTRRLCIRHDNSVDGNMNLRVDTGVRSSSGETLDLTLFHLRMHDLKNREFSLRRYCRDSGREICNTNRKYTKPASERRPGLQRSMSSAFASLKSKTETKTSLKASLKRHDSGYDSMTEDDDGLDDDTQNPSPGSFPMPADTTNIEFSNYAHVDLKRRGAKSSKRYEFEYWGASYAWRRAVKKDGDAKEMSYHLYSNQASAAIAHIVPTPMTPSEAQEEERKGGWVPPSSLWISDGKLLTSSTDVADVIVATGLVAFVGDCIKNKWHRKDRFQFALPASMLSAKRLNVEYIGPKQLIDQVFNRHGQSATRHTPLRQASARA